MLILHILSYRDQPLPAAAPGHFSTAGGTLGRAPDNALVLDDPAKIISRAQAKISWRAGAYFMEDLGNNSSIVNGQALGRGREIMLADGDRIQVGDYRLEVGLAAEPPAAHGAASVDDTAMPPCAAPPSSPRPVAAVAAMPSSSAGAPDALARARILDIGPASGQSAGRDDPLGLNLFGAPPPALAQGGLHGLNLAPRLRGAESDHLSPELAPLVLAATPILAAQASAIPEDYDPLADFLPPPEATPPPVPAPPPAPTAKTASLAADDEVLTALLRGLGLPHLQSSSPAALAETAGAMLREALAGTMAVLMARALTKRESRIDMTMMAVRSNNPLKFFPHVDGALTQLLTNAMVGYLAPVQAVAGAFDDVKAHELAVIAGMRATLAAMLERLNPADIERREAPPGSFDKLAGGAARKARMWDRMVALHGRLAADLERDQGALGDAFSGAYEEQVARLRAGAAAINSTKEARHHGLEK